MVLKICLTICSDDFLMERSIGLCIERPPEHFKTVIIK